MKDIYHDEALFFSRQSGIFERFANALAEINKPAEEILNEDDRSIKDYDEGERFDPEADRTANDYQ
jgi:hypothetical protein